MGIRRYAKSGLGFLLAFALITTATPAAASQAAQDTAQGGAAQQVGGQLAAQWTAGAPAGESVTAKVAEAPAAEPSKVTGTAGTATPVTPAAPVVEKTQPEPQVKPEPTPGPAEPQQITNPAAEPATDPAAAPTQTAPPASGTEETAETAPEQPDLVAAPVAKSMEDTPSDRDEKNKDSDEEDSGEIVVKVYKMVTNADGDIATAVPKADWEFSVAGGSIKDANDKAITNENGLAVFSGKAPGKDGSSGKANVVIQETDSALSEYELVQLPNGDNAVCSVNGEPLDVDNPEEVDSAFKVKAYPGEPVTCTVYNRPLESATLKLVNKVEHGIDGSASASDWNLIATPKMTSDKTITTTDSPQGKTLQVTPGTYQLSETSGPANYTWLSLKCSTDGNPAVDIKDFDIDLEAGTETTCTFTNAYQAITIDKRAWNTPSFVPGVIYPDSPEFDDGALVPFQTIVTWTYTVKNTGATVISGIKVDDDKLAATVKCPYSELKPGKSMICTASGLLTG